MQAVGLDIRQDYSNELDDRADWYVPMVAYDLYSAVLLLHVHPHQSWCQHGTRSYMLSLFLPVYLKIADRAERDTFVDEVLMSTGYTILHMDSFDEKLLEREIIGIDAQ